MATRVCILDYGSGNVKSVYNLVTTLAEHVEISNEPRAIQEATHLILPGVGAFGASMIKIKNRLPLGIIETDVRNGKPFLGICVGLQVLAEKGYEFGEHPGLGWIPGIVDRIDSHGLPLPHIGWNDIMIKGNSPLLQGLNKQDFYFVHSFVFRARSDDSVMATACYGEEFACVLNKGNVYGVQFHPEKSQKAGRVLVQNFLRL
ncbi:MAG: imidazole glycerol phosphate synthase subunit HisH [Pseudomonadota bacterium]